MIVYPCSASPPSAKQARISISPVSSPRDPAAGCSEQAWRPDNSISVSSRRPIQTDAPQVGSAARPATSRRSASSATQHVCEAVDVLGRPAFGDGDEQGVVEALVVSAKGVPGMNPLRARVADCLLRVPSDADRKLLERCPFRK